MIGAPGRVTAFRRRPRRREDAPRAAVDADLRIVDVAPIFFMRRQPGTRVYPASQNDYTSLYRNFQEPIEKFP